MGVSVDCGAIVLYVWAAHRLCCCVVSAGALQIGSQPNLPRRGDGNTALHLLLLRYARVGSGHGAASAAETTATLATAMKVLVEHGARLAMVNADGKSAEALATAVGVRALSEAASAFTAKTWPATFVPPPGMPCRAQLYPTADGGVTGHTHAQTQARTRRNTCPRTPHTKCPSTHRMRAATDAMAHCMQS